MLLATLLQPEDIAVQGMAWWYVGPRNGHVSLFSRQALEAAARQLGARVGSLDQGTHVLLRKVPPFARKLFPSWQW